MGAFETVNYGIRLASEALGSLLGIRKTLLIAGTGGALSVLWLPPSPIPAIRSLAGVKEER